MIIPIADLRRAPLLEAGSTARVDSTAKPPRARTARTSARSPVAASYVGPAALANSAVVWSNALRGAAFTKADLESKASTRHPQRRPQVDPSIHPQARRRTVIGMAFRVRFEDETTTVVQGADAYEQEGPLTTFFDRNGGGRLASAFTMRVASFRTSRIVEVRRQSSSTRSSASTTTSHLCAHAPQR